MSASDRDAIYGWGVVRPSPLDFVGLYASQYEAQAKAKSLGSEYAVLYGEQNSRTGQFTSTTQSAIGFNRSGTRPSQLS